MKFNKISDASPTHIDEAPHTLRIDELEFFCKVMMTEKVKQHNERKCEPIQERSKSDIDFSADLDTLFMSEVSKHFT